MYVITIETIMKAMDLCAVLSYLDRQTVVQYE